MTYNNSHPLANPFNTRAFGNYNIDRQTQYGSYIKGMDSKNLQVPIAKPLSQEDIIERNNSLQVPHQNQIPMGQENNIAYLEPERFYQNGDMTIDLKTQKIVSQNTNDEGCWGSSKVKYKMHGENSKEWNTQETFPLGNGNRLTQSDIEYAEHCKKNEAEMKKNMTDEQKDLLNNLDNIIGKSCLEIEK